MTQSTPTNGTANRPIERINVGPVKVAIWKNEGPNGPMFSATFQRSYRDPETNGWKSSTSFGTGELLQLSKAADRAHSRLLVLREVERQSQQTENVSDERGSESAEQEVQRSRQTAASATSRGKGRAQGGR